MGKDEMGAAGMNGDEAGAIVAHGPLPTEDGARGGAFWTG